MLEDCHDDYTSSSKHAHHSFSSSTYLPTMFKEYLNDSTKIPANEKSKSLIAACFGVVPGFSVKSVPCATLNKNFRQKNNITHGIMISVIESPT